VVLPLPVAAELTVSHGADEVTLQGQLARFAVRVNDPLDGVAGAAPDDGEIEYTQGAASCVTVNVFPPTVNAAVRISPLLAATL
jgi:hypothetical protein